MASQADSTLRTEQIAASSQADFKSVDLFESKEKLEEQLQELFNKKSIRPLFFESLSGDSIEALCLLSRYLLLICPKKFPTKRAKNLIAKAEVLFYEQAACDQLLANNLMKIQMVPLSGEHPLLVEAAPFAKILLDKAKNRFWATIKIPPLDQPSILEEKESLPLVWTITLMEAELAALAEAVKTLGVDVFLDLTYPAINNSKQFLGSLCQSTEAAINKLNMCLISVEKNPSIHFLKELFIKKAAVDPRFKANIVRLESEVLKKEEKNLLLLGASLASKILEEVEKPEIEVSSFRFSVLSI